VVDYPRDGFAGRQKGRPEEEGRRRPGAGQVRRARSSGPTGKIFLVQSVVDAVLLAGRHRQ